MNRLNKTKEEKQVDFRAERENRDRLEREDKKRQFKKEELASKYYIFLVLCLEQPRLVSQLILNHLNMSLKIVLEMYM